MLLTYTTFGVVIGYHHNRDLRINKSSTIIELFMQLTGPAEQVLDADKFEKSCQTEVI